MFQTKITEMLGIKHPIVVGTMMHLARAEMVAAASNAGALGILASHNFQSKEALRQELRKLKGMTDRPFGVCISLFPARYPVDIRIYVQVLLEEGVKIVETSGDHAPEEFAKDLKDQGVILIHKCVGVRYALKAQRIGADIVTVVGCENGGATGTLDVTTLCLVPRVVDALKIPVIGGGGVADARGFLALLALGAEGVIMGTAFLVAEECPLHPRVKQAIIEATEVDTMVILRSVKNSHRVWINEAAKKVAALEKQNAGLQEIVQAASGDKAKKMFQEGDIQGGTISIGQGVGLVKKIMPLRDIIEKIIHEADQLRKQLAVK
jgi:NADH:quinone reductase (non-electrogenic)